VIGSQSAQCVIILEQYDVLTLLEGLGNIIIAETTQPERPRDFTVLLRYRFARCEECAEHVEADEQVLLRHDVMDFWSEKEIE
jgi:hypothetical protein